MADTAMPNVSGGVPMPPMPPDLPPEVAADWDDIAFMFLTEDDLPCDDGEPMETERHRKQMTLLLEVLEYYWAERTDWYAGGNMFIYFSPTQVKTQDFRGPDFFAVLGVPKRERKSFVCWQEEATPDVIIELLSDKTRTFDKTEKKRIYQDRLRVPEYFYFDPHSYEWAGFVLRDGRYEPIVPDEQNRLICKRLGLALVQREGLFQGYGGTWLRWETLDGYLLPTGEEWARTEQQKAIIAQQGAAAAQQEAAAAQQAAVAAQQAAVAAQREKQNAEERAAALEAELAKYRAQFGDLPQE